MKKIEVPYLRLVWSDGSVIKREHLDTSEEEISEDGMATIPAVVMNFMAEIAKRRNVDLRDIFQSVMKYGLTIIEILDDPKQQLYLVDENGTQKIT